MYDRAYAWTVKKLGVVGNLPLRLYYPFGAVSFRKLKLKLELKLKLLAWKIGF